MVENMDKNPNEDIKAKMQAALSRKFRTNGIPKAELEGKNKKLGTSVQNVGTKECKALWILDKDAASRLTLK